ncbi:SWIM zinc finger family protein [Kitasatospora sp. NPDC058965]|uniref:SWIM zinc finger family protein n=1 Tax=Kitasatospora sp. NPDC058965 TaxID=3346682 RepID=UPI00368B1040
MEERRNSGPADPLAAARRAERRAARVAAGAEELRLHLADRVRAGLAESDPAGWERLAARMVDAQAPGLAASARELAALPVDGRLAGHALLHLLATAYRRVDELPDPLAATVRGRVGFTQDTAALLAGPTVRDHWLVLGSRELVQEPLTTRRTWLRGTRSGRAALLVDHGRPGRGSAPALPTGHLLEADLAFHPAARPLRAVLGRCHGAPERVPAAPPGRPVAAAPAAYGEAVAADPWTESWPVVLAGVVPLPDPHGWRLTDGRHALPVRPPAGGEAGLWRLAAVSGGRPVTVFGECGHQGFDPVTVWDERGDPIGVPA